MCIPVPASSNDICCQQVVAVIIAMIFFARKGGSIKRAMTSAEYVKWGHIDPGPHKPPHYVCHVTRNNDLEYWDFLHAMQRPEGGPGSDVR